MKGYSVPNQKKFDINKRQWRLYLMIGFEEIRTAAKELTHGALKLYLYLSENVDNYEGWLSPKDICDKYGMSKSTYDRAKAELISKGYIVEEGNQVHFYTNKEDSEIGIQKLKQRLIEICAKIDIKNELEGYNFKQKIAEAKLKKMYNEDKKEYIKKVKEFIDIGEGILLKYTGKDVEDLL